MAEKVGMEKIERAPGRLYFVDKQGYVGSSMIGHKGGKRRESKTAVHREKGKLYYLGKSGYVESTVRKSGRAREKG